MFISHGQNLEDVVLYRALRGVQRGFYIDVGAQDPMLDSVTRAFYDRGWRGINIEPVEEWFQKLRKERADDTNLRLAAWSCTATLKFFEVVNTGLSTTVRELADRWREQGYRVLEHEVPAKPLDLICAELGVKEVHFLKIDVEGAEAEVLKGLSLTGVRPWILVVEATEPNSRTPTHEGWEYLLIEKRYELAYFDGLNRFYVAREHADLKPLLSIPPNVFDDYVRHREWVSDQALASARAELTRKDELLALKDREIYELHQALASARAELTRKDELLALKDREIYELHHSEAYRFGLFCTWPLRKLWRLLLQTPRPFRFSWPAWVGAPAPLVSYLVRWAWGRSRLRAIGKRLVKSPQLRARLKQMVLAAPLSSPGSVVPAAATPRDHDLPESARDVLDELKRALDRESGIARR
jgi:FkbM family methyltransferase